MTLVDTAGYSLHEDLINLINTEKPLVQNIF